MRVMGKNRIIAIISAIVVFMVSMCTYSSNAEAATSTRTYWRHDYSNTDLSSYYEYSLTTSTSETSVNSRVVIDDNDMIRDYDTAVVRLSIGGTGFIVGDHLIATAAHCVYNRTDDEFINFSIDIVSANNSTLLTVFPKYVHICSLYETVGYGRSPYDYALIYVEEDLSEYGAFSLGLALDSYISNEGSVIVSGFPQEYPENYEDLDWGIRFKAVGNILSEENNEVMLRYDADTAGGDSGGPVYIEEAYQVNGVLYENKAVIAINVSHYPDYNNGVRINNDLLKFYGGNTYLTA